ncbi:MAG TPA: sigma-70 family RNA polymerase sigma factor, partial [Anaerolineae bacterium]|nr:sigma-70 family RNA polymerase sigma factor [Anaerolineae bacterium]
QLKGRCGVSMGPPTGADNEAEVIRRARSGDQAALGQLYERYVDAVYRYMLYRTGSRETAEDLSAEVFAQMLTAIARYEDKGLPFGAWLFRIARARLVDYWRQSRRREEQFLPLSDEVEASFVGAESAEGEGMASRGDSRALLQALGYLSQAERELILLRFAAGLNNQEIALIVNSNSKAVKSMMYRALRKLREILERQEQFYRSQDEGRG